MKINHRRIRLSNMKFHEILLSDLVEGSAQVAEEP